MYTALPGLFVEVPVFSYRNPGSNNTRKKKQKTEAGRKAHGGRRR